MGDKGKKDKEKSHKQKLKKQEQANKRALEIHIDGPADRATEKKLRSER